MSRTNRDTLWSVTSNDILHIKKALNALLGDVASASLRLEVFARMAGFRTYAGLRTRLESFHDVNGKPFPLQLNERAVEDRDFFEGLDPALRRRLAEVEEIGFMRLIIAALVQARHPILGDIGLPEDVSINSLTQTAERLFNLNQIPRDTGDMSGVRDAVLVLTPKNTQDVHSHNAYSVFQFSFTDSDDVPMNPAGPSFELTSDPQRMAELTANRIVYTYSTDDIFSIRAMTAGATAPKPLNYMQLKDMTAHLLSVDTDMSFLAMATAFEPNIEDELDADTPAELRAMEWILMMLLAAEAYHELQVDQIANAL